MSKDKSDPQKFLKRDNEWLSKLGGKRSKLLRKLAHGLRRFNDGEICLPFDLPIISVDIIYRGERDSWFHDHLNEECKVLLRVKGLDEEGLAIHLNEIAKVIQWILWVPLIGDPNTSKQASDRVWREKTFTNPAEFLQYYVNDSKTEVLEELVVDRWDTGMMLGGSENVRNLIQKHISTDNEQLKRGINEWLRFLKWHQEFDWEEVSEHVLFGNSNPKLDIFWESEEYEVPEKYVSTCVWTTDRPNFAENIRTFVAGVPGFFFMKATLDEEVINDEDACTENIMGLPLPDSVSSFVDQNSSASAQVEYRPDMPYNGANKVAFDSQFKGRTVRENSSCDYVTGERSRSFQSKPLKVKAAKRKQKYLRQTTPVSKKAPKKGSQKKTSVSKNKSSKKRKKSPKELKRKKRK